MNRAGFPLVLTVLLLLTACGLPTYLVGGFGYHIRGNEVVYTSGGGSDSYVRTTIVEGADGATFKILEHDYGKDSTNVWQSFNRIDGADAASFVVLNDNYARDSYRVYAATRPIQDADPATFVALGDTKYARDENALYVDEGKVRRISVCDIGSLELISGHWLKDKSCAYYDGKKVEGADPASFKVLTQNIAKDNVAIYVWDKRLPACDVESFVSIEGWNDLSAAHGWQKDRECYYFGGKIIHGVDFPTFKVIADFYAKDRDHVFYGDKIVQGADPETFKIIFYYAKDKNGCFEFGKPRPCPSK